MNCVALLCLAWQAAASERSVNFNTEIIPVLTKAGCNGGPCHGAAAGRGGFHLSLLGADPTADYETIVQAFEGRRINLARPESSLVLTKPTGQLDHGGDMALDEAGPGAGRILAWIRSGAPRGSQRRLVSLEVMPRRQLLVNLNVSVPLRVVAQFEDGPSEDVTDWTVFTSADPAAVEIQRDAIARIKRRGQHVVIARFLDRVLPIQFAVPFSDDAVDLSHQPRVNFVDDEVLRVLSALRLPVAPPASESAFLRRVSLDLTGRLPDLAAIESFLADSSPDKRERLVETLLASEAFADYWTLRFARLLRLHSLPNEKEAVQTYADWLHRGIGGGIPLDVLALQLLTSTGDSHVVGPANFGRMVADARGHAELVGQFFLGMRLGCANCHNHPLDKWTQDDYHGLAAVFARLERGRDVRVVSRGAVTNLRTNEPAVPRIPGERYMTPEGDHRAEVAEWITSAGNRYFARATVNRLWRAMFGRGLVEPTDDLRDTNPSTHPELLDRLAADFVEHGHSLRHTLRLIALSATYGRSETVVAGNAMDDRFYSHAHRRQLMPEVLADAIADVTGVAHEFEGEAARRRAVTIVDPLSPAPSLDVLGRCHRAAGCDENATSGGDLPAQLHLLNGELINRKLTDDQGRLHRLIEAGRTNDEIVGEFYLRSLARSPSADELARWRDRLAADDPVERQGRLEDFAWSLLNSRQFMENH